MSHKSIKNIFIALGIVFLISYLYFQTKLPASDLNTKIQDYIATAKSSSLITNASVYVERLNTGQSYGFQEDEKYEPRSLFKVTDLMAYLKESESDPAILSQMRTYNPYFGQGVHYQPNKLVFGQYTVSALLTQLITQSDDAALQALYKGDQSAGIYTDLGFPPFKDGAPYYVSPKNAAKMFDALYRDTILPNDLSDQALDLLSNTKFTEGIVGGVPTGTRVAHKFGENSILGDAGGVKGRGLNDCGIVFTNDPYIICIMTLGPDFSGLETTIQGISQLIYSEMSK